MAATTSRPVLYIPFQCSDRTQYSLLGLIHSRTSSRTKVPLLVNPAPSEAEEVSQVIHSPCLFRTTNHRVQLLDQPTHSASSNHSSRSSLQRTRCLETLVLATLGLLPLVRFTIASHLCISVVDKFHRVGAFGQSGAPSTSTSAFNAPKPTSGFGAFGGGTSAFNAGGNAFGGTSTAGTPGTNLFASNTPAAGSAFGGGGSIFGQNKPAATFGATSPSEWGQLL
jgi:hypothetical protein